MKKILISGASIAGPTLGYWLARHGWDVTLVERAPAVRPGGYAVDVRGAALEVVARMGLLPAMRAGSTDTETTTFIDARGRRVATFTRGFGVIRPDDIEILRGDLAQLLYATTRPQLRYQFDDSIAALAEDADGVDVTFARGPSARFDYVVGADGLHSNVRALAFAPEAACVRPLGSAIAIFTAGNHGRLDRAQVMLMAPGHVASIKSDRGNGTVKATLIFPWRAPSTATRGDVDAQRRATVDAFAALAARCPPLAPLLADVQTAPDFYFDGVCQVRLPAWQRGRVLLVGDAAYGPSPLTGQGSSLALIGAHELGRALTEAHEPAAVGARYEARLRPFVERNQDLALHAAKTFAPLTSFGAWFRNLNLRLLPYVPWRDAIFALMMRDVDRAATALTLEPEPTAGDIEPFTAAQVGGASRRVAASD